MYAILDIETTGGKYNEEGITEIAIYRFDGHRVTDQFASLVNPEREIQPFVVNLTGINNDMLRNAPKFYEVAKRIIEITKDCILVAHNAEFDNRILSTEFDRLGYPYEKEALCTVELSKKLLPDMESYSLGKLSRSLGIPLSDRHRAQGDAKATVSLFKLLLSKDSDKEIIQKFIKKDSKKRLDTKLLDIIEKMPSTTGVYYIQNEEGEIIYIGRSKNLKRKITKHFTNENRLGKQIQLQTHHITFEETGNELIAQLKEMEEIRRVKPALNFSGRKKFFKHQLVSFMDNDGYLRLRIIPSHSEKDSIITFTNYQQAKSRLFQLIEEFTLCQQLTGITSHKGDCLAYKTNECFGACIGEENPSSYNERVAQLIEKYSLKNKSLLIVDRGREVEERSFLLLENGDLKGYGFYNLNYQVTNPEVLKSIVTPLENNTDKLHIIQQYLNKNRAHKIVKLTPNTVD